MACGCKNKPTQTNNQQQTPVTTQQVQKSVNPNIQESIKKVVEKYYKK